jgi:hypothetical protein
VLAVIATLVVLGMAVAAWLASHYEEAAKAVPVPVLTNHEER